MQIKVWSGYFYGLDATGVYVAETEDRLMAILAEFNDEEGDQYFGICDFDVIETEQCEVVK